MPETISLVQLADDSYFSNYHIELQIMQPIIYCRVFACHVIPFLPRSINPLESQLSFQEKPAIKKHLCLLF